MPRYGEGGFPASMRTTRGMTAVGWKSRRFEGTNEGDTLQSDAGLRPPCFDGDEVATLLIPRTRN